MHLCWSHCRSQLSFVNLHFLFYLVPFFLKISASCQNFPSTFRQFLKLFQTEHYSDHHAYALCSLPDIYCTFFSAPIFISLFFNTPLYHIVSTSPLPSPILRILFMIYRCIWGGIPVYHQSATNKHAPLFNKKLTYRYPKKKESTGIYIPPEKSTVIEVPW